MTITTSTRREIRALRERGLSFARIAALTGVSQYTAMKYGSPENEAQYSAREKTLAKNYTEEQRAARRKRSREYQRKLRQELKK